MPSESVAGSSATGLSGNDEIFIRRLHLRQLEFIYQGQLSRLASLQVRQQHLVELENQAANWSGFSEPSLHLFLREDELKESVTNLSSRVDELESWLSTIDQARAQIINTAENSTVKLRQAIKPEVSWKAIASDLRIMINKTLTEKGIVISFPQRDIHLDTSRPLEIRVLADAPDAGSVKG